MSDSHEIFKTMVEKVRNDEELNRVMHSTPIRDQWRQIIVVLLFVSIVAGTFFFRTKRFKTVMNTLESSPVLTKLAKKPVLRVSAEPDLSDIPKQPVAVKVENTGGEADIEALQKNNEAIGATMGKLSGGPTKVVEPLPEENGLPAPVAKTTLDGISNKTPEPELDAFSAVIPAPSAYREEKKLPASYSREKIEFPDLL